MCYFILEKNLLPTNWLVNQKKNLFWKGLRNLKNHMTKVMLQGEHCLKICLDYYWIYSNYQLKQFEWNFQSIQKELFDSYKRKSFFPVIVTI